MDWSQSKCFRTNFAILRILATELYFVERKLYTLELWWILKSIRVQRFRQCGSVTLLVYNIQDTMLGGYHGYAQRLQETAVALFEEMIYWISVKQLLMVSLSRSNAGSIIEKMCNGAYGEMSMLLYTQQMAEKAIRDIISYLTTAKRMPTTADVEYKPAIKLTRGQYEYFFQYWRFALWSFSYDGFGNSDVYKEVIMAVNGVYIVQGELNAVVAMLRRGGGSGGKTASATGMLIIDEQDPLLRSFADLRDVLNSVNDLADMAPSSFLSPFLEVIHSEQTSGPVTGQALAALSKFLSYGLVDPDSMTAASAVQQIADAVTHARFVGTDPGSDEVVLLRILQVLRALLLTPVGALLTDEAVCEILQSCFRICFETRLSQLLRKAAESCITDMSQLLFTRLPTFIEDPRHPYIRRLKMRAGHKSSGSVSSAGYHQNGKHKLKKRPSQPVAPVSEQNDGDKTEPDNSEGTKTQDDTDNENTPAVRIDSDGLESVNAEAVSHSEQTSGPAQADSENETAPSQEAKVEPASVVVDVHGNLGFDNEECSLSRAASNCDLPEAGSNEGSTRLIEGAMEKSETGASVVSNIVSSDMDTIPETLTNDRGVRFTTGVDDSGSVEHSSQGMTSSSATGGSSSSHPRSPYGLPCVRELLRFLVALINPLEPQNTEHMLELGLNLLTVALEAGADHLGNYGLLLPLIQNELCRALVALVSNSHQKPTIFAGATRVGFLVFEALRTHLKLQFEAYLTKLMDLVTAAELGIVTGAPGQTSGNASAAGSPTGIGMPVGVRSEQKELALEALVQLWRVPGLVTELYLNYDCDLYCANLFEEMTKLLSKNAFPAAGLTGAHLLSLDGLLTVVDTIETNCHFRMLNYKENQVKQRQLQVTLAVEDAGKMNVGGQQIGADTDGRRVSSPSRLLPAASGYSAGKSLPFGSVNTRSAIVDSTSSSSNSVPPEVAEVLRLPQIRPNRMPITSTSIPSHEDLIAQKQKKRLLVTGTELFNQQPSKGVQFLQDHGLLRTPLCPDELVVWLKENPRLDKRKIAEYIVNRKNTKILEAFVQSFDFKGQRIDESLRSFLETFRLPGEAAEISMVVEHFADHWFKSNNCQFASVDAGFTLAYAVIMLNVDQHNQIAKRQQQPMTADAFKRNLNGVNGGGNFDQAMLEEIYHAIKSEEIVMPAEHTGLIKENYLWKLLLKRTIVTTQSGAIEAHFVHAPSGLYDHDLFTLVWGPTVAAVSFVFDKSQDEVIVSKAICGFRKCAAIAAHYGMSDVFDNLIINLCKFSTIASASSLENSDQLGIAFGDNNKAQLATKAMFQLVHHHGDILREGWKNLLDCLGHLFRSRLLPAALIEVEDYSDPKGWVSILKEPQKQGGRKPPKSESGIFSSLYSWVGGGADTKEGRGPTAEELELIRQSKHIVQECHPEQLVSDSKYLTSEALAEFLKSLVVASVASTSSADGDRGSSGNVAGSIGALSEVAEQTAVFYLELIISVALENRDRLAPFWRTIRSHLFSLLSDFSDARFLTERAIVGLLRLATRLLSREELTDEVVQSLAMLRTLKFATVTLLSREMSYGVHELLRTNAANIHKRDHWTILFQLLETIGAAAYEFPEESAPQMQPKEQETAVPANIIGSQSDTEEGNQREEVDRGYTSDSEIYEKKMSDPSSLSRASSGGAEEWTYVEKMGTSVNEINVEKGNENGNAGKTTAASLVLRSRLRRHDPAAYIKCCETLAFLVRDAAHITPDNFDSCVRCLRTFIEAGLDGGSHYGAVGGMEGNGQGGEDERTAGNRKRKTRSQRNEEEQRRLRRRQEGYDDNMETGQEQLDEETRRQLTMNYTQLALQLLDLTHALHVKASVIYRSWAEANPGLIDASSTNMWMHCWRPLLQALARLCCDRRKQVRSAALTYLQRALLTHDLQELNAVDWGNCFYEVLFPLLTALLDESIGRPGDRQLHQQQSAYDEIRVRASTLVSKVYLQHLCPLSASPSFKDLWLLLLDFMERYLRLNSGDLNESIPESVKNLLLVMQTAGVFKMSPGLIAATKERLMAFLPDLANGLVIAVEETDQANIHQQPSQAAVTPDAGGEQKPQPMASMPSPTPAPLEEVIVVQDHQVNRHVYTAGSPYHTTPNRTDSPPPPFGRAASLTRFAGNAPSPPHVDLMSSLIQQGPPTASHIVLHPPASSSGSVQ